MTTENKVLYTTADSLWILYGLVISLCLLFPALLIGQSIENEWIICLKANESIESVVGKQTHSAHAILVELKQEIAPRHQLYVITTNSPTAKANQIEDYLSTHKAIEYIQANRILESREEIPDDEYYGEQWSLGMTAIDKVWSTTTGGVTTLGDTIVVGVIDRGFDYLHDDLRENVWKNQAEIADDGMDNDGNGYVDDFWGWNFRYNNNQHDQMPNSGIPHGTAVAGIVGAVGNNNRGVTGVNWQVKMMLLTVKGVESDILSAYYYMLDQRRLYNQTNGEKGAFVVASSISLGISQAQADDFPIWCELYNILGAEGIISVAATTNSHVNVDVKGDIPTACTSDYLLTVTNTNEHDLLVFQAGYGLESIDIGAPGNNSYSTDTNGSYDVFNGTSAATPHVAGTIALLYSLPCTKMLEELQTNPEQTALWMKNTLLENVDERSSLKGMVKSGGRLNAANTMLAIGDYCVENTPNLALKVSPNPIAPNTASILLAYESLDFEAHHIFIHNALGQLVYEQSILPDAFTAKELEIPNRFTEGVYFISLKNNSGRYITERFVVN